VLVSRVATVDDEPAPDTPAESHAG